ncbi:MAG: endonuclease/exonuclease/phosphatase family protein [Bacteroidota bacterium]
MRKTETFWAAFFAAGLVLLLASGCEPSASEPDGLDSLTVRVMTFNIEDVRGSDLDVGEQPRLARITAVVDSMRPDVLILNEIAYDSLGVTAQRFADRYLAGAYTAYMPPVNTGFASGLDLDNNGEAVTTYPPPPPAGPDGAPAQQTPEGRAYGNDAFGFGTFPGQYGMALLVREGFAIDSTGIRSFQTLPWSAMPDALRPMDPESGEFWYDDDEWPRFRLSSKTHVDVPVRLTNGSTLHLVLAHPTPPAFDGAEARNKRRNHDEIRLLADYLNGEAYIVDDAGQIGGIPQDARFLIAGDLNADPDEGSSIDDPIGRYLLSHPRVQGDFVPEASPERIASWPDLDPDDTAGWGLRVDYVLPSTGLRIDAGGVYRPASPEEPAISDHFPVWVDVVVP